MGLENFYLGDKAFSEFSAAFNDQWSSFQHKEALLTLLGNDVELARPIAFKLGNEFEAWLKKRVPALDQDTPLECLKSKIGIQKLKTCLMRMH